MCRFAPVVFAVLVFLPSCESTRSDARSIGIVPPMDPHSCARPAEVRVDDLSLDLAVDFESETLSGTATLALSRRDPSAPLRLDTDGLTIHRVRDGDVELDWKLGPTDPHLGTPLIISLGPATRSVAVEYSTAPDAAALQWLGPEQTAGRSHPFLFTQGQAILTRTWVPLQDSPGVRITYRADIAIDPALSADGVTAVMSASVREDLGGGRFRFALDKPIPSYLLALAVGGLEQREISPRCAVWAEPSVVARAAREFEDTERMIVACERLYGPYRWGRYDILVLPPAFPFGGMENPCMTFATPTILAGDKSLVALIAHELAHSWSGNLVTNATWRDFWLNEGFTVYLEQRIIEEIYGTERARMETILGMRQLARELRALPREDQRLHIDLTGRNPDDGMTAVAYDKGATFLRRLEEIVGRERFDAFLNRYFDTHAFQSITTDAFLDYLDEELFAGHPGDAAQIDLDAWVRGPGLPVDAPTLESPEFARVDAARDAWIQGTPPARLATSIWATPHWLHFLGGIPAGLDVSRLAALDAEFGLTQSGNAEILAKWLEISIGLGYRGANGRAVDAKLEEFLLEVGRRKFLKPLYAALIKTDAGKQRALSIYERARPRYHAVSRRTLDELLDWQG